MGTVSKLTGVLATSISKVSGVVITSFAKIAGQLVSLFTNTNAVAKSITVTDAQSIRLHDTNAMGVEWDQSDDFSISFWVKPGWNSTHSSSTYLFFMNDIGGGVHDNTIRMWYKRSNNRLNVDWRSSSTAKTSQFWLFHSQAAAYVDSYNAAGLGASYWSSANRGNVGDDDYTMITITKGTGTSSAFTNLDLYWNGTTCGNGFYSSGNNTGTPSMGNNDRQIALGSSTYGTYNLSGNAAETKFDGLTMWDKRLTAADVAELYNSGTPIDATTHSASSDLKGYWEFEANGNATVGGEAFVISGNSNIEVR
jgi:hypothetical protein